ncbi:MAG TPA: glycosyltransferase [Xanthobacteraceae bacterium]|nr:glycosyltransferase [Xanthobacteraceae bacterium]
MSVALPTFRRPQLLRRAAESVLQQHFTDWELIISDDEGPEGASWPIAMEYAERDARIRVIANAHCRGQVENTNTAMLACEGEWIKLLHDDDWLAPGALAEFADVARCYPNAAFVTCAVNMIDGDGLRTYSPPRRAPRVSVYSGQEALVDLYLARATRSVGIAPSTLLIRSDVVRRGCLMRVYRSITSGIDQVFFLDLAARGPMVMLREGLVFYDGTDHASISTETSFEQVDAETIDLKELTWSLIKDHRSLPPPPAVVGALRLARLRNRYRRQPLRATIADALEFLRPSVMRVAGEAVLARLWRIVPPS